MNAQTVLGELKEAGVTLSVDGENLILNGKQSAITQDMLGVVRQHKPALMELLAFKPSAKVADEPPPSKSEPLPYIHRCYQCGGTNWGAIRTELEISASGLEREVETWDCLNCNPLAPELRLEGDSDPRCDDDALEATESGDQCPECSGTNIVTDSIGKYCVDCRRRPWERHPTESPRESIPIYVGVKWSESETGYLELTNSVSGEVVEVAAKGLPSWVFKRLNGGGRDAPRRDNGL